MYHLLIERVSTVTIEFLQFRARVRIGLNRAGIKRAVERTGLFTSQNFSDALIHYIAARYMPKIPHDRGF
jgi:hypothetical protein